MLRNQNQGSAPCNNSPAAIFSKGIIQIIQKIIDIYFMIGHDQLRKP